MSAKIVVPELSESVVEATVSEWKKQEGEAVEAGEIIVVLETDKVSLEVTAEQSGILSRIEKPVGADVGPGEILGIIETVLAIEKESPQRPDVSSPMPKAVPVDGIARDSQRSTPVAQRVAAAHNIDITQVSSNIPGSKVTKKDVQQFIDSGQKNNNQRLSETKQHTPPILVPQSTVNEGRREERIRMSRRRRTIALRLVEAQRTAAMLTTFNEIDMSAVMDLRKRRKDTFKEKHGISLGLSSFFVKATIGALKAFPRLNAEIQDNEIILKHYYDIGIAIGAEEGLIVPVLRDADRMSFAEIEKQIRLYVQQSEEGTLSVESLMGGTFTITNGGVFGSMMSTPILNPPQVGILGLHAIKDRPVVAGGQIVIRPMMYVALTYDHRIVDGREAVQFLVNVKELVEDPESLLIEG